MRIPHSIPQPRRVFSEVVLSVRPAGDRRAAAGAGDDEPEDGEGHECEYDEQYDDEVQPQCPCNMETCADETRERNYEDDEADDEQRRLEELLAGCAAPRQP